MNNDYFLYLIKNLKNQSSMILQKRNEMIGSGRYGTNNAKNERIKQDDDHVLPKHGIQKRNKNILCKREYDHY
jgi:hypothetical protein